MATNRLEILKAMLEQNPKDSFARYGLAMEYAKSGQLEQAVGEYRALLEYNEHDCRALRHVWLKASFELDTWRSYERTTYCFQPAKGARVCFKIGSVDKKRDAALDRAGVSRWAFITAWNPASSRLPATENSRRQSELAAELDAAGYAYLPGEGIGEGTTWAPEESVFVMGISGREARRLGRKFGQLAIVVGHKSQPARLVRC